MKALQEQIHPLKSKIISPHAIYESLLISLQRIGLDNLDKGARNELIKSFIEAFSALATTYKEALELLAIVEKEVNTDNKIYELTKDQIEKLKNFSTYVLTAAKEKKTEAKALLKNGEDIKNHIEAYLSFLKDLDRRQEIEIRSLLKLKDALVQHKKYFIEE